MQKIQTIRNDKLFIEDGALELLKWLALILMTGDHINTYLLNNSNQILFSLGRLVMPLFVFILIYNLTRPGVFEEGKYIPIIKRMLFFGIISMPVIHLLGGDIVRVTDGKTSYMLNILFTLALLVWCIYAFEKSKKEKYWEVVGWFSFFVLGYFVEYWWIALLLGISTWLYYKNTNIITVLFLGVIALFFLWDISSQNYFMLVFIPIIFLASKIKVDLPRMKWFFYSYYPLHLTLIYAISLVFKNY